ncbi:DUF2190 family protein [Tabrizicola thermarum]|uniref:DUF2190 family protein n=1 Tax=Tabrizicola thermarum TaxID=2670345 RepID=UPI001EE49B33|nr:DUF2190 family protein [Tabrizicola thermarum]
MKNYLQNGHIVRVTTPAGGIASGDALIVGSIFGIAAYSSAEGDPVELSTTTGPQRRIKRKLTRLKKRELMPLSYRAQPRSRNLTCIQLCLNISGLSLASRVRTH